MKADNKSGVAHLRAEIGGIMATEIYSLHGLRLFEDGGDGASAAAPGEGVQATADANPTAVGKVPRRENPLKNVQFGKGDEPANKQPAGNQAGTQGNAEPAQNPGQGQEETFDEAIKGRYKEAFEQKVQSILNERFKGAKADKDRLSRQDKLLAVVAEKYGMADASDLDALGKAINDDDSYIEQAAYDRGVSTDVYKQMRSLEREKAEAESQRQQAVQQMLVQQRVQAIEQQAEQARQIYPGLDMDVEMQNPAFRRLIDANVPVQQAYEVVHREQVLGSAMQYAARSAAQKVANSVQANARRPDENGISSGAPAATRITDPKKLTPAMRQEIRDRVRRGEKIVW